MLGYIIQVPINWGQSNINLSGFLWLGALSSQAEGGFLMLEYQKSSAAFSLTAQLRVRVKFPTTIFAVRSCVRMGWVGDDFWYPSMRNPPTPSSHSVLSKKLQFPPARAAEILASSCNVSSALNPECTNNTRPSGLTNIEVGMVLMANFFADSPCGS